MSKQIREIQQGDIVAVMKTTMGEIKIVLFPMQHLKLLKILQHTLKTVIITESSSTELFLNL